MPDTHETLRRPHEKLIDPHRRASYAEKAGTHRYDTPTGQQAKCTADVGIHTQALSQAAEQQAEVGINDDPAQVVEQVLARGEPRAR